MKAPLLMVVGVAALWGCAPILDCEAPGCDGCCTSGSGGGGGTSCAGGVCAGGGGIPFGGGIPAGGGGGGPPFIHVTPSTYTPAPAMGGTLTVVGDAFAVASDPDRDRVWVVDLAGRSLKGIVQLPVGSRPVHSVADAAGKVHVVLRGEARVLHVDPALVDLTGAAGVEGSDAVCPEPRGITVDPTTKELLVACQGGELVRFAPGGSPSTILAGDDLRDVLVASSGKVSVSTFKGARLFVPGTSSASAAGSFSPEFSPGVAWKTVDVQGSTAMLHQAASVVPITTGQGDGGVPGGSAYGVRGACLDPSVVLPALSVFNEAGVRTTTFALSGVSTATDLAVRAVGSQWTAAVAAMNGLAVYSLRPEAAARADGGRPFPDGGVGACQSSVFPQFITRASSGPLSDSFSGVAFTTSGQLVAHRRAPAAELLVIDLERLTLGSFEHTAVSLASDSVDTDGSNLFHTPPQSAGVTIACAGCHPEGGEDGRVWVVNGEARRTQSLRGGVMQRTPFHWSGDLPQLSDLMGETFVRRMGGALPPPEAIASLGQWLNTLPERRPSVRDAHTVAQGRAAFEKASCDACHSGPQLTNNALTNVGTGGLFKTPPLKGVAGRGPWMHTGCARTLKERFNPACGGAFHGNPAALSAGELDALVVYLESL